VEHVERRASHALASHPIPAMTNPQGRSWDQPTREAITIDEKYALMTDSTFRMLAEYSGTSPTGVYPGKMWRRHDGAYDRRFLASGGQPKWLLCWYDVSPRGADWCSTKFREIIIV
jgi:hypothetical protein